MQRSQPSPSAALRSLLSDAGSLPLPPPKVSGYAQVTNDGQVKLWPQFGRQKLRWSRMVADLLLEGPGVSPHLMQASTLGGEASKISVPFRDFAIGDISPDPVPVLVTAFRVKGIKAIDGITAFSGHAVPPAGPQGS